MKRAKAKKISLMASKEKVMDHNTLSEISFGASMALFAVSSTQALDSIGFAIIAVASMAYCMLWLLVNIEVGL